MHAIVLMFMTWIDACTIASIINFSPKGVRFSEKPQLAAVPTVMKFDRSNKFDLCYCRQVNSQRLKSSVTFECAGQHL